MKKKLLYLIIPVALAACGDNKNETTTGTGTDTENVTTTGNNEARSGKNINDMPAAIRTAFQNRYQNVMVDEWERETENNQEVYKVDFKQNNAEKKVWFDMNGNFLREEND